MTNGGKPKRTGRVPPIWLGRSSRPCDRSVADSWPQQVGVVYILVAGERPNTDCRNKPTSRWRRFCPRGGDARAK